MNLRSLETIQAILVHGSFTAAGEAVGCTTSAISLQVRQLEQFFGQPLFDRSTRTVRPTPFAIQLASLTTGFIEQIHGFRHHHRVTVDGRIRLGAITTMLSDRLPNMLLVLQRQHPRLEVRIPHLKDSREILAELSAGRIDIALVVRPQGGGSSRLCWQDLACQPYVMLVPPGTADRSPQQLVRTFGWLAYDTTLAGGRVAARLVRTLLPASTPRLELRSVDALVAMVAVELGVTVVPQPRRRLIAAYGVHEIDLGRRVPQRRIALAWRKTDQDDRRIRALVDAFLAEQSHAGGRAADRRSPSDS